MKNLINVVLAITLSSFMFAQGVFDQYDIPEYDYRTFQVSGDDLFNMVSAGETSTMNIGLGADYMSMSQSPGYNCMYGLDFDFAMWSESTEAADTSTSNWNMSVPFEVSKYFGGTKGAFGFADGNFDMWGGDQVAEGDDDTSDLWLKVGAGYGRIVSARPVAQAYAIADALGIDGSDETILAIASVLGASGSYASIYKDDATQQFYNDLADAAGSSGSAMQIQKVLTSPAYNISDRFTGYRVRASLYDNYMRAEGDETEGDLLVEADYAMPMGMDGQLSVGGEYGMNMAENGPTTMGVDLTYTLDHSYNWATVASFDYDSWTAGDITTSLITLSASTTYAVLNQMSVTGSFGYAMPDLVPDVDEDAEMKLSATVTYWVF